MLNPIFWNKVNGLKHPGRWEIAERQIASIKILFKRNTKGHNHPSIRLFIIENDTIGKTRKTKSGIQPKNRTLPPKQSYRMWWSAASPILNDTPVNSIYSSYNRTHTKMHIYKYIYTALLDGNKGHQEEAHHPIYRLRRLFLDPCCQWDGEDVSAPLERSNSHPQTMHTIEILRGYAIRSGRRPEGSQRLQGGPAVLPRPLTSLLSSSNIVVAVSLATISCQCIRYISSVGFPRNLCRIWVAGCRDADFVPSPQGWPVLGRKIRDHPVWGGRTQAVLRHICCPTGGFPCRG